MARTALPSPPPRTALRRRRLLLVGSALFLFAVLLAVVAALSWIDAPPRSLALYLERRLAQHSSLLVRPGASLTRLLTHLDRGSEAPPIPLPTAIGARVDTAPSSSAQAGTPVLVASEDEIHRAIEQAHPGDLITLEPGTYRFSGSSILITQPGTAQAPIVVRAIRPGTVLIEMDNLEGFVVAAPHWHFENLTIRGVCKEHTACDHAFHVVGEATHFVARNNTLVDFNAHFKINGQNRHFPDQGLIEGNTMANTAPRRTDSPVTPIDLVAASGWTMRGNLITDFIKAGGDRISYGAFAKGSGSGNRFERNVVLCEYLLRDKPGWRVGLSLGGGGSGNGREFCRDNACALEQQDGAIESNLIASCSDDGIYINRGANSKILNNTLIDTGGITVRFVESGAEVEGNLVDGTIRSRDGALLHADDNLKTGMTALYLGRHPQRQLFRDALALDLAWAATPPRRAPTTASPADLCQAARPPRPTYGAFEDIAACEPKRLAGRR